MSHCQLNLAVGKGAPHLQTKMSSGWEELQAAELVLVQEQLMAGVLVLAQAQAQLMAAELG